MKTMYIWVILYIVIIGCSDNKELRGWDIEIFADTEVYSIAKDLEAGDTSNVYKYRQLLNIQEPNFGFTLLHWSTFRNDLSSCVSLLNNGANPNVFDHKKMTPLFYSTYPSCSFDILKVLVDNGAAINIVSNHPQCTTPLFGAVVVSLTKTKYLVNNGAKVDYMKVNKQFSGESKWTALRWALLRSKLDVVKFLLFNTKTNYDIIWAVDMEGNEIDICKYLINEKYPKGSSNWYTKMEILDSLQSWGHDCNQIMDERLEAKKKR